MIVQEFGQPPGWMSIARQALQVLIPIVLVLTSVRLLLTDAFIRLEYGLPGFPADPYGLTQADRLRLAPQALDYLLNDAGIEFLGDLHFADGSPLYNARELRHMEDVKAVTRAALVVWQIGLLAAVMLGLVLWRAAGAESLAQALQTGGRATLILMGVLLVGLAAAFSILFVGFHRVFFEAGTWTFHYSDTLIRLFPERFWQVAFGAIGVGTALQALSLLLPARWMARR